MPVISMLQQGNAVGRATKGAAPPAKPVATAASTGAPGSAPGAASAPGADGQGAAPPPSGFGSLVMLLPFVLLFGLIFMMQRGDKKKRAALESKLKKGDRVITRAGFIGKITQMGERTVRIEIAPGVNTTMLKSHIEGLDGGDVAAKDDKSGKPSDSKQEKGGSDSKKK